MPSSRRTRFTTTKRPRSLALSAILLAVGLAASSASAQYVMVTDSSAGRVMLLSATDGSIVNANFIPDAGGVPFDFQTPKEAIQVGTEIWVSDQVADAIFCFTATLTPTYVRTISGQLDNIRGLGLVGNQVFVSNDGANNGATANSIAVYDLAGNRVNTFVTIGTSPFDCHDFNGDVLVPDFDVDDLFLYNTDGTLDRVFHDSTGINTTEQAIVANTGPAGAQEVWAAGFGAPAGIYRYDANGVQLAYYGGIGSGHRGVWVLNSGDVLYTSGSEMGKFTPGGSATSLMTGTGFQFFGRLDLGSGPGADVAAALIAPAGCSVGPGGTLAYTVRLTNFGDDPTAPYTLTVNLPAASVATFASATPPPTTVTATQVIFNLPSLPGGLGQTDVVVNLTAVGAGTTASITAAATVPADTNPANNSASASTLIQPAAPTTAAARAIFSTNPALANSTIPGGGGRFTSFDRPFASPSGNWWVIRADTDLATTMDSVLIRSATGGTPAIVVQEGITATSNGIVGIFDAGAEVSDNGIVVFSGDDAGPTASDEFVATTNGTTVTDAAREGQPNPAMPGVNFGTGSGAANILANGQAGFSFTSTPTGSTGYLSNNGATIVARLNVTMPTGASAVIDTMVSNTTGDGGFALDASGTHSIYQADINTGASTDDQVIVADGIVIMQEGVTVLPGLLSPVTGATKVFTMGAGGTWMVRGINTDAEEDWVIRGTGSTIAQVYTTGDLIHTGATESWQEDPTFTGTFFMQAADASGNYVIGGMTSNPNDFADAVIVYNNQAVLARENDPVDLDGDGIFDDGVYIRSFGNDDVAFVSGAVLLSVTLRDTDAALCGLNNTDRGQALIRVPLPTPPCPADADGNGQIEPADVATFISIWFTSIQNGTLAGDFDHNGAVEPSDVAAFVSAWFNALTGGGC